MGISIITLCATGLMLGSVGCHCSMSRYKFNSNFTTDFVTELEQSLPEQGMQLQMCPIWNILL